MKILHTVLRILLGLMLLVFGLNKFLGFMPAMNFGEDLAAANFFESLSKTGYMLPLIGLTEIVAGLLLVIKKWVPFALVILAPITVNIILFHLILNLPNIGPALVVTILNIVLIYKHWGAYRPLFS